jgi:hypothetical protein
MTDDRLDRDRDLSTADIAAAADERYRPRDGTIEREVSLPRSASRVDYDDDGALHLLPDDVVSDLRPRWSQVQASFVDAPRQAVEDADKLVADAMHRLAEAFASTRADLERDWDRGEDVSTEDLRLALRRYRAFFDRLLAV